LYRLYLTGDVGLPSTLIVKLPAESKARGAMEMLGGYQRELSFYEDVAGAAPIQTPHVHAARMARISVDFVLLLEDLWDWENAEHLVGLLLERARLCIEQLAGLHAWSVDSANADALAHFPSLGTPLARDLFLPAFGLACQVYLRESSVPVPPSAARFAERFVEHAPKALEALTERSIAAAWRHPRRQHVLRGRPVEGGRLPDRGSRRPVPPTSRTWSTRACPLRCAGVVTRSWSASIWKASPVIASSTTRSTRRGGTTGSPSPI